MKRAFRLNRDITPPDLDGWNFEFEIDDDRGRVNKLIQCGCSGRQAACLVIKLGTDNRTLAAIAIVAGYITDEIKTKKQLLDSNGKLPSPLNSSSHFTLEEAKALAKGEKVSIKDVWR